MFGIKATITKCIDDTGYPSFVECQFTDAGGNLKIFHDKDAIFTVKMFDQISSYPTDGIIGCKIIEREIINGEEFIKINTSLPCYIESISGETEFIVKPEQIIEFE